MQPIPVFLPKESHGQRSLEGYSPQGHKESDRTEVTEHARMPVTLILHMHACLVTQLCPALSMHACIVSL